MPAMWDRLRATGAASATSTSEANKPPRPINDIWSDPKGLGVHSPVRYHIQRGVAVRDLPQDYEPAPPVQQPPPRNPNRTVHRNSIGRPPSSVYSQPSPIQSNFATVASRQTWSSAVEDISPPSSPEVLTPQDGPRNQDPDISPVDEIPNMSLRDDDRPREPPTQQRTNIPMMRRDRRKQQDAVANTLREKASRERMHGSGSPQPERKADTKWDPMTGEQTDKANGRAGQVKPVEYAQGLGTSKAAKLAAKNAPQPFGERIRLRAPTGAASDGSSVAPPPPSSTATPLEARPAWQGASGREAIVDRVRDNPAVAPLNIPRKSSKRAVAATRGNSVAAQHSGPLSPVSPSGSETSLGAPPTIRRVVPSSQQQHVPAPLEQHPAIRGTAQASSYPSPPDSGSSPTPAPSGQVNAKAQSQLAKAQAKLAQLKSQAGLRKQLQSPLQSPTKEINTKSDSAGRAEQATPKRKPLLSAQANNSGPSHTTQPSTSSSVYSNHQLSQSQDNTPPPPPPHLTPSFPSYPNESDEAWTQPPSRFSVTTYATSAHTGSPRPSAESERPPMPTPPQLSSVLDRTRPKLGETTEDYRPSPKGEPIRISLAGPHKSTPFTTSNGMAPPTRTTATARTQLPSQQRGPQHSSGRPSSILSTTKALPPAPPEMDSVHDRVAHLNALLEGLTHRRVNINKSIKQMTELMPTDNLMASEAVIRKREAEKRKVESLKTELAEIQREEYELGLKLHRAYKRMDRDAEFEPTTLWVRRVTG